MELNLAKYVKDSKKGFFKYISNKRNTREYVGLLLNGTGTLATWVTEKAELLNNFFASVFTAKAMSGIPDPGDQGEGLEKRKTFPWLRRIELETI